MAHVTSHDNHDSNAAASTLLVEHARQILASLPPAHFAFAYGSAVIPQRHVDPTRRVVDLVVAVDDAHLWHSRNLALNPSHYSLPMSLLGPAAIARAQRSPFGARVLFNTVLSPPRTGPPFKYGVIEVAHLEHDLCYWDSLYLSGRLQKPVRLMHPCVLTPPASLANALQANLDAAAAAALLTLPERFRESDFYRAVAALSYTGDVRMRLALEVSTKVPDLVEANLRSFRALYANAAPLRVHVSDPLRNAPTQPQALTTPPPTAAPTAPAPAPQSSPPPPLTTASVWRRDTSPDAQLALLGELPLHVRSRIAHNLAATPRTAETTVRDREAVAHAVVTALSAVVARSSVRQAVMGLASAGLSNSLRYVGSKLCKSMSAQLRGLGSLRR